uniref:Uncharacterized protein n=1 Tax=Chromera velia CCMP2878 TaxID=1169474 RepID=A0A0G4HKB6_9ALVE|eukprot:Cvel_7268.t1-p1 / transcript=Cvel_7268.t1 / gene=Cvel_7268 / organism=Chromera_velia_CCMP2878 / gene_product=Magnesium-transporting ATPase, P-type 1, putative / transcript_product=Magnesium-transporting ATPase, P-type 1, putative / location=Cvel_scaffold375:86309-92563(-) / protein_length=1088 / sequence_SO=supercontig / SO=protein_coding / is_pseudo=false
MQVGDSGDVKRMHGDASALRPFLADRGDASPSLRQFDSSRTQETAVPVDNEKRALTTAVGVPPEKVLAWVEAEFGSVEELPGLSREEVIAQRELFGPNTVDSGHKMHWAVRLFWCYATPFNLLLTVIGVVSLLVDSLGGDDDDDDSDGDGLPAAIVTAVMIILSTGLQFVSELRSEAQAERLVQALAVSSVVKVKRDREWREEMGRNLVPGDVVELHAGGVVPADGIVLSVPTALLVQQASLTGESLPVQKETLNSNEAVETERETEEGEEKPDNQVFMGTDVVSGRAVVLVTSTGGRTELGRTARGASDGGRVGTAFDRSMRMVALVLISFTVVTAVCVFFIKLGIEGFTKEAFGGAALFAVSVGVGLTPELMPLIVATCLEAGVRAMARLGIIVKHTKAVQNIGAMTVLCTDKTGTLTENRIVLVEEQGTALTTAATDKYQHPGAAAAPNAAGGILKGSPSLTVLRSAALMAKLQTGLDEHNPIDSAILESLERHSEARGEGLDSLDGSVELVREFPFDFQRRRMSLVLSDEGNEVIVCKGAAADVLSVCTRVAVDAPWLLDEGGMGDAASAVATIGRALGSPSGGSESEGVAGVVHKSVTVAASVRGHVMSLEGQGMRVVAVAARRWEEREREAETGSPSRSAHKSTHHHHSHRKRVVRPSKVEDAEQDLILLGLLCFSDTPKASAASAIFELRSAGVQVKVLTGDSAGAALSVSRSLSLFSPLPPEGHAEASITRGHAVAPTRDHHRPVPLSASCGPLEEALEDLEEGRVVLTGAEVGEMGDEALLERAREATIFARLSPDQKARVVKALQTDGEVVGFLGDGVNDAAALGHADVGVTVSSALEVAQHAAGMVMQAADLRVIAEAVKAGRRTCANTQKYLRMTASSNFGNVFSVLIAVVWMPAGFYPIRALQLLLQNLLYDISQLAIPTDAVDMEQIKNPCRWEAGSLSKFMVFFGPLSSLFDVATFAVLWFVIKANVVERQEVFQAGWFLEGLISQTLIVHFIRTKKIPFIQSSPSLALLGSTVLVCVVGVSLVYIPPAAAWLKFEVPPAGYIPWLIAILLGYGLLTQAMKRIYLYVEPLAWD